MPMPIGTDLSGASVRGRSRHRLKTGPVFLPMTEGIRLSDILNLRVGCWSPAVYVEPCRKFEA